jgi:opacity protein-like surface antigen
MTSTATTIRALASAVMAVCALTGPVAAQCIAPTVAAARIGGVTRSDGLNHYRVVMNIENAHDAQPSDTLQFVDIYHDGVKLDAIGVPPLKSSGSYSAAYTFTRSSDAGEGTTTLNLQIEMRQPVCKITGPYTIAF